MTARLMTDTEVQLQWCPMSRVRNTSADVAYNRQKISNTEFSTPPETRCIGSGCGMWVESGHKEEKDEAGEIHLIKKGFCGLAQKPTEI